MSHSVLCGFGAPYSGPYHVLLQREKTLQLLVHGRPITISTDLVKPAYILNGPDSWNTTFNPVVDATSAIAPPVTPPPSAARTTCFDLHVRFPLRFNI